MNFQDLKKIEKYEFYLDVAFNRAKDTAKNLRQKKSKDRLAKSKMIELGRLSTIQQTLTNYLDEILISFPSIDQLDDFYRELVKCTLDYETLKKSLGAVKWAKDKVQHFFRIYNEKVKKSRDIRVMNTKRREFYGRISSVLKQISENLEYLEYARRTMRDYPSIKSGMFTVSIVGFPNVGKTTLLTELTDATPEINSYPFTTKTLNLGYLKVSYKKIQLIDTPGTLNRFNKMNNIEKQAYLSLQYAADMIVYVFDLTEEYPLKDQVRLYRRIKKFKKPVIMYLSKVNLVAMKSVEDFKKKFPDAITSPEILKKELISSWKQ